MIFSGKLFVAKYIGFGIGISKSLSALINAFGFEEGAPILIKLGFDKGVLTRINFGGDALLKALVNRPIKCKSLLLLDLPPKTTPIKRIPFLSTEAIKLKPEAPI